jgi:cell division protein ZapB
MPPQEPTGKKRCYHQAASPHIPDLWRNTGIQGIPEHDRSRRPVRFDGISIDRLSAPNYSEGMDSLEQTGKDLQRLEQQLRKLLEQTQKLSEENKSLQTRQDSLVAERASLVAKNDEARTKVEAMIHRLKALEQA